MVYRDFAVQTLLTLSSLLGVSSVDLGPHRDLWQTSGAWAREDGYLTFRASSEEIPKLCRANPGGVIEFPAIVQAAHDIFLDGKLIEHYGDRKFSVVEKIYGRPVIKCALVSAGTRLDWVTSSAADYFARITYLPTVTERPSSYNTFAQTFHTAAAAVMIVIGIYTLFLFSGPVSLSLSLSVFGSCLLMALYFLMCGSDDFGLRFDMLTAHKIADTSIWFAIFMLFNAYRIEGMLAGRGLMIYALSVAVGVTMIALGTSCDEVQLGTTIPYFSGLFVILTLALKSGAGGFDLIKDRQRALQTLSLFVYLAGLTYEMGPITGLVSSPPLMPLTQIGGVLFLVFSVNQRIAVAYQERDHLRKNLQREVEDKTLELRSALGDLKSTQAELVQSAKLASLGTLAAGIAHEINNSLNYVNGSLGPLQKIVYAVPEIKDNVKVQKLFMAMNEGMRLSVEIIASLRNYTGLNQAKFNDVPLKTVVKSVLTILKPRVPRTTIVNIDVAPELTVFANVVGLNQIFMNLITNALDAMPETGTLTISARDEANMVAISVSDTGAGMPAAVISRIFDPFFTTKAVGKGTGLGLHIVKGEIEKHKGTLTVTSEPGLGTTFEMIFPKLADCELMNQDEKKSA